MRQTSWVAAAFLIATAVGLLGSQRPPWPASQPPHGRVPGPTAEEEGDPGPRPASPQTPAHPAASPEFPPLQRSAARVQKLVPNGAKRNEAPRKAPRPVVRATGTGVEPVRRPAQVSGRRGTESVSAGRRAGMWDSGGSPNGGLPKSPPVAAGGLGGPGAAGRDDRTVAGSGPAEGHAGSAGEDVRTPGQEVWGNPSGEATAPAATPSSPIPAEPRVTPPRAVYAPPPQYPGIRLVVEPGPGTPYAAGMGSQGRVRLRLLVRSDGSVGHVEVVVPSGEPELDRAAVEALRRWKFEPARREGQPVDSYYLVWVSFELR